MDGYFARSSAGCRLHVVAIFLAVWANGGCGKSPSESETWDAVYLHGDKVGFSQTLSKPRLEAGQSLVEISSNNHVGLNRFGDRNELEIRTLSLEMPTGEVVRFELETTLGRAPVRIEGRRQGDTLEVVTTSGQHRQSATLPWRASTRGFQGIEQSLQQKPLAPGETRRLSLLVPIANQVIIADVVLSATDFETTELLDGPHRLLRIDNVLTISGAQTAAIESVLWTDARGTALKSFVAGIEQATYRTTKDQALAAPAPPKYDLGTDEIVKLAEPLKNPRHSHRVRYRVELAGSDPAKVFAAVQNQQVTSLGPHEAEIVVTAPGTDGSKVSISQQPVADDEPTDDDRTPNNLIESDDPTIIKMAAEARGDAQGDWAVAQALEKFVHRTVVDKNFGQALASAAEVARTRQGDCTEHSVLLAALARANALPARVAVGLVYVVDRQGFGYHMWNEVYVDGAWLPLDATLGLGGIGADHLKLGVSSLKSANSFGSLLAVVQLLGRLKITVVEAE